MKQLLLITVLLLTIFGGSCLAGADDSIPTLPPAAPPPQPMPDLKEFNIRLDPLALILGEVSADFDIGVANSVTVGPELLLISRDYEGTQVSGGAIGARANIYLGHPRFTDGWIIGPFLDLIGLQVAEDGFNTTKITGTALGTAIAYQWVWSSGFNLDLGGTVGFFSFPGSVNLTDDSGNTTSVDLAYTAGFLGVEFSLGYAF